MEKVIVTTTVSAPTYALTKFIEIGKKKGWDIIVAGDLKTPHEEYEKLESTHPHVHYLSPVIQSKKWSKLSKAIGFNCIQRRNFGFLEAYECDAKIIATIDDDNIPYDFWGDDILLNQKQLHVNWLMPSPKAVNVVDPILGAFDNSPDMKCWHRGFPVDRVKDRYGQHWDGKPMSIYPEVQAEFWNGDLDVDAICRMTMGTYYKFSTKMDPFGTTCLTPFNSQNTLISRRMLPFYMMLPHVGRIQ